MSYSQLAQIGPASEVAEAFAGEEFGHLRLNWCKPVVFGIDWAAGEAAGWAWDATRVGPTTFSLRAAVPGLAAAMIVARRYYQADDTVTALQRPRLPSSRSVAAA